MTWLTYRVSRALGRRGWGMAMRSSSPSWTITPTSTRGEPSSGRRGITIRQARMTAETGQLDWDDLDRCLNQHGTKVLAIGAAAPWERSTIFRGPWPWRTRLKRSRSLTRCIRASSARWTFRRRAVTFWRAPRSFMDPM